MTNPLRTPDKAEPRYACQSATDLATRLTPRSVRWLFAKYAERAGLDPEKMAHILWRALSVPTRSRKGIMREGWSGQWEQTYVPNASVLT